MTAGLVMLGVLGVLLVLWLVFVAWLGGRDDIPRT